MKLIDLKNYTNYKKLILKGNFRFFITHIFNDFIKVKSYMLTKFINLRNYFLEEFLFDLEEFPEKLFARRKKAIRKITAVFLLIFNLFFIMNKIRKSKKINRKKIMFFDFSKLKINLILIFYNLLIIMQIIFFLFAVLVHLSFHYFGNIMLYGVELITHKPVKMLTRFFFSKLMKLLLKLILLLGIDVRSFIIYKILNKFIVHLKSYYKHIIKFN